MAKTIAITPWTGQPGAATLLGAFQSAACDRIFGTPGVVIGTSSKAKIKTTNSVYPVINGALFAAITSAETALPATTVLHLNYCIFVLYTVDGSALVVAAGTQATTLAAATWPTLPANAAVLGMVFVHPTGTGSFVAGTNDLDDGTITPTAVFVDCVHFNPGLLLSL